MPSSKAVTPAKASASNSGAGAVPASPNWYSDYAGGLRTLLKPLDEHDDFARGQRTLPVNGETGGDFASGQRQMPQDRNVGPDFARGQH